MHSKVLRYILIIAALGVGFLLGAGSDFLRREREPLRFAPRQFVRVIADTLPSPRVTPEALSPVALNGLFKQAAARARDAVVFIEVESPERLDVPQDRFHDFDEDMLRRYFQRRYRRSAGSGVIVDPRGYIVTNHHVVEDARRIMVMLNDHREFEAELVGTDPTTDLAVLRIPVDEPVAPVAFGNSDSVEVGEWVLAIGNPFRLTSTVTAGIVSALGRQVGIISDSLRIEDFIQTDAAINPGNSGGALINLWGELVGINTAIATERGTYEGYGFAIPVNLVRRVVEDLIAYGEVHRGYLGVEITAVTASIAEEYGLPAVRGVLVVRVLPGSSAEQAGLREGDIILAVDGQPVNAPNQLQRRVALRRPGDRVALEVWRRGRRLTLAVPLMSREAEPLRRWQLRPEVPEPPLEEAPEETSSVREVLGMGLRPLSPQDVRAFRVAAGAYVAYVRGDSPAARAGLPRDVVIVAIDRTPVQSVEEALRLLQQARDAHLIEVVRRDGRRAFYEMLVPESLVEPSQ